MSDSNYWLRLRRNRLSRRALLGASARAGVGAAGLALVGCGDDDDTATTTAAVQQQAQQQQEAPAQQQAQAQQQAEQAQAQEQTAQEVEQEAEEQAVAAGREVNLDAHLRLPVGRDAGGLDYLRSGSHLNYINTGSTFQSPMVTDFASSALTSNTMTFEVVTDTNYIVNHLPGVFHHDGVQQTAEDILFTAQRAGELAEYHDGGATTDHPSGTWTSSRKIFGAGEWESYELADPMTLKIDVAEPDGTFFGLFFNLGTMPKHYVEAVGDAEMDRNPLGSGAFKFVSHTDDTDFVYTRFDDFHRGRPDGASNVPYHLPWVKDLTAPVRPELLTQVAGLEAGELDAVVGLTPDLVEPFLDDDKIQVIYQTAANPTHQLMPNTHVDTQPDGSPNPWRDLRVRQAANHAINRELFINNVLTGTERVSFGPGPTHNGYDIPQSVKDEIEFKFDPDKAKALLAEAGYPDGFETTIHIVTDFQAVVNILSLVVQQDLAAVGINATIKEYPSANYFSDDAVRARPGEAGLWWFFTCSCPEPESYIGAEIRSGAFYTMSEYPETNIQELYQAQKTEMDAVARSEALRQLNIAHYKNASWIYLHEAKEGVLLAENVEWDTGVAGIRGPGNHSTIKIYKT